MPSDERALATWLTTREDVALAETFALRGVSPGIGWNDFFDAADALLEPAWLDRAITALPRDALAALVSDEAAPAPLISVLGPLALLDADGRVFGPVRARAEALRASTPDAFTRPSDAAPPAPSDPQQSAAAAERLFTTAGALADVLIAAHATPLGRTGAGAISAVDRKRLIESGAAESAEELDDLILLAESAGLAAAAEREWTVTAGAHEWLQSPTAARWRTVAEAFRAALPSGVRNASGGWTPPGTWTEAYPLDPEWPERVTRLLRAARRWGLMSSDGTEPAWSAGLRAGDDADASTLTALLPTEIDRVYLQADLSAIAPGPLAPALDLRLRGMAVRESRAQASTYRFTAGSLTLALTEGETARSIRAFLASLSLTGIPQPLDYLIESTSARHGLIRVADDPETGRTRVESDDPGLLEALAVDQALRPLGLVVFGTALTTRVARDAVYWALADARYPIVAVDAVGAAETMHRRAAASGPSTPDAPPAVYARLIATLRSGHGDSGEEAWLQRELEQWVRARTALVVTVRMPDGSERALTIEATGLGGGRLRGRDRGADVERTLPVSSIVSVKPL